MKHWLVEPKRVCLLGQVAWVTRSGKTELAEPIAVRPTSETGLSHGLCGASQVLLLCLRRVSVSLQSCIQHMQNGSSRTETCPSNSTSGVMLWLVSSYVLNTALYNCPK